VAERVDTVVIGAGAVGLAVARAFALAGHEVLVLERNAQIGEGISARNSEVIHGGLYYPTGSRKAVLCVRGRALLYEYCRNRQIAHRRCGKLVVAIDSEQVDALEALRRQAIANGVDDTALLTTSVLRRRAPALDAVAALHSPSTGIIDSHGLMLAMQGDLEAAGGTVALRATVVGGNVDRRGLRLDVESGGTSTEISADCVINSASLDASRVARSFDGLSPASVPETRYAKGNYFVLAAPCPFSELIYPLPEPGGLGVHLTLDLAGRARFGPDVEWLDTVDFRVDPRRADAFYGAIRRYWPGLPDGSLQPGYAGVRPKLVGPGEPAADFMISGPAEHGIPGLVNLFGIESPGLTAALAIGEEVLSTMMA
jgi:L-2-hydroxyglutarate oxidase LhgO